MVQEADKFYEQKDEHWIETFTGRKFSLESPDFHHEDIAHALAHNCRFNGHTSLFYSVAEHSMLVSALVYHWGGNKQQCLEALLHDATEAYMSDIPAPFKQHLPDWREWDHKLDSALRLWAGLPQDKTGLVKEADWVALYIEAYWLIADRGESFPGPKEYRDKALQYVDSGHGIVYCLDPRDAKKAFLGSWADLAEE